MKKILFTYFLIYSISLSFGQTYFKIDSLKRELQNSDTAKKVAIYNEIVWRLRNSHPYEAIEYGKKAVEIAKKTKINNELAKSYGFLGVSYRNVSNFDEALVYYKLGLEIAEQNSLTEQLGYAHNNFGNWYLYSINRNKALFHLNKALKIAQETDNKTMIAYCFLNIGRAHLIREDKNKIFEEPDIAMDLINKALKIREKIKDVSGQSVCYKYIADIYLLKNGTVKALEMFKKALNSADKKFDKDLLADIYDKIANINIDNNQLKKAEFNVKLGLEAALQTNSYARIRHSYNTLSKLESKLGNFKAALKYQQFFKLYNDSLYKEKLKVKVSNVRFEIENKEKQNKINQLKQEQELNKLQIKQRNTQNFALIVILCLVSIVAVILIIANRQRKKAYSLLDDQKNEIQGQHEEIESQRDEISIQHDAIVRQQVKITESIQYAQRIQRAALPPVGNLNELFNHNFILYLPRDIVSGDFYWYKKIKNKIVITVADSTGHGVPGAFVSMLGMSLLNEVVTKRKLTVANEILEELRNHIKTSLRQEISNESQDDGMDMALCIIDSETLLLEYSGANNPIYIYRNNELLILEPTLNPVGIYFREKPFKNIEFQLKPNDTLYMFSDGYVDQFGGPQNRRFMSQRFRSLLTEIQKYPVKTQKNILEKKFTEWKGDNKQIDDILVMGIKIT